MTVRILLSLFAITVAAIFGQTPAPVKAGDPAPGLIWTRTLAGGVPGSFFGRITVIGFFPAFTPNESLVSRWNQLVTKFTGQAVHFIWITSEYQPPLDHWLDQYPVSGCLLLDPLGATAKAYGVEFGGVIVDANGRVAGFWSWDGLQVYDLTADHRYRPLLRTFILTIVTEPSRRGRSSLTP